MQRLIITAFHVVTCRVLPDFMLERQREGVVKAKAVGKYKGRKPIDKNRQQEVIRLAAEGMSKVNIARHFWVGEATVFRTLKAAKAYLIP